MLNSIVGWAWVCISEAFMAVKKKTLKQPKELCEEEIVYAL